VGGSFPAFVNYNLIGSQIVPPDARWSGMFAFSPQNHKNEIAQKGGELKSSTTYIAIKL
jgi:hypothetical protein